VKLCKHAVLEKWDLLPTSLLRRRASALPVACAMRLHSRRVAGSHLSFDC
jgi:hypothetical protein